VVKSLGGILISISGIDGAGKSTLIHQLQDFLLQEYSRPSRSIWCKFGSHPLSRYRLPKTPDRPQIATLPLPQPAQRPSTLYTIYAQMLLAWHLAQIALVVRRALQQGQTVICDRYTFDTMVDLQQELQYSLAQAQRIMSARWIPQPVCKFLLDLPAEVAFTRKTDTRSLEFLQQRRVMYLDIARIYNLTMFNATWPAAQVAQIAQEKIRSSLQEASGR
jgi:thymidylate kinase